MIRSRTIQFCSGFEGKMIINKLGVNMNLKTIFLAAALYSTQSYGFICELGTCTQQCTDPDSVIGEQPLPSSPDINNGNYVDCIYACIDLKAKLQCRDATPYPWIYGSGDNLDKPDLANVLVYQTDTFRAYVEPSFTPQDRQLIKESLETAVEQLGVFFLKDPMNSGLGKCTSGLNYDHFEMADFWGLNFWNVNTYGHANIWRESREPSWPYIPGFPGVKYDLRIVKVWKDNILGRAYLGDASVARPVIALNWNHLKGYGRDRDGNIVPVPAYGHPGYWAGTIAHEILHTIGATHPDVNYDDPENVKKYKSTFMVAFSDCITKQAMPEFDPNSKLSVYE
jgi:hypothetical protein